MQRICELLCVWFGHKWDEPWRTPNIVATHGTRCRRCGETMSFYVDACRYRDNPWDDPIFGSYFRDHGPIGPPPLAPRRTPSRVIRELD